MRDEVFEFRWKVAEGGYQWVRTIPRDSPSARPQPILTDGVPLGTRFRAVEYAPLRAHSGLFRVLAETSPTERGVLDFASRFGLLGEHVMIDVERIGEKQWREGTGEPLSFWRQQILSMREALAMWDMACAGDAEGLARRIRWVEHSRILYEGPLGFRLIASERVHPELLERASPGDVFNPTKAYVQRVINEHLKDRVSPRLLWNREHTRLGLHFVPRTLIGGLWLQFARAIDGDKEYRRCRACEKYIEISFDSTGSRIDRTLCSNACRSRVYRDRQAEARRLAARGLPVRSIAKKLKTDVQTVKRWVRQTS